MTARIRLGLIAGIIILSAAYAVMVKRDPQFAAAVASGYVALVLTVYVTVQLWRKP